MEIRLAKYDDCDKLVSLIDELYIYHVDFSENFKMNNDHFNLTKNILVEKIENPNSDIIICINDNDIIGMIILSYSIYERFYIEKRGYIYETIINEKYRKKGIGSKLINEAFIWFKNKNIDNIELQVSSSNKEAVKFWNKNGFELVTYHLIKKLDF